MKKVISILTVVLLTIALSAPVAAADAPSSKEEAVYGILGLDGSVESIYVVNSFAGGDILDYGSYAKVQNLTSSEKIEQNGDTITVHTDSEKFYYMGTLDSKELPWKIGISYYLDGKQVSGSDLAGKSGALRIGISIRQNTNVNCTYFDNYALQVGVTLDTKLCENITTTNATVAQAGSDKQLNYTILPGKEEDISLTADVKDFQMDPITVNGIKLTMNMDIDYSEISGQISQLVDAIKELDNGAGSLLDGAKQLATGMDKYVSGMETFKNGLSQLSGGVGELNTGAAALSGGLSELVKQNDALVNGALAIQQATFDAVNQKLATMMPGLPELTPENYEEILKDIPALAEVKAQLDGAVQFTQGITAYTGGVAQLSEGASGLAEGTNELNNNVSTIATSANDLYNAGAQINSGLAGLRDGLSEYKNGTSQMKSETADMNSQMTEQINALIDSISGSGDKTVSFVSDKNTNITALQFVLKTSDIKTEKKVNDQITTSTKLSFWEKFLKLFGVEK